MSLEAIAQMLGHRSMRMTLVYARIADRTVADEYFAAADKVDQLYSPICCAGLIAETVILRGEMCDVSQHTGCPASPVEAVEKSASVPTPALA